MAKAAPCEKSTSASWPSSTNDAPRYHEERTMKEIPTLSTDQERAAAIFRALGNPARVAIVSELARRTACVSDLVATLPLAQSTVSQHLKVLKEAGIVRGEVEGQGACYCLDPDVIQWLATFCYDLCCPPREGESCCNETRPVT